jgi:hypothetical protein
MIYPNGLLQALLRHRFSRIVAVFLSLSLIYMSSLFVPTIVRGDQQPPPAILVLPITNGAGPSYDGMTSDLTGIVRLKVNDLGYYRATAYSVLNPSLQRALNVDNSLSPSEVTTPSASPDRAQKIASIIGSPYFLVTNLDSISTDTTTGTVSVVMDGAFYQTDTGAVINHASVSGIAAPSSKTYDPQAIQESAVDNATGKLISSLIGPQFNRPSPTATVSSSKSKHMNLGAGLLFVLAVALALVLANNHGHSNGGSSGNSGGSTTGSSGGTVTTTTTGGTTTGGTTTGGPGGPPAPPI